MFSQRRDVLKGLLSLPFMQTSVQQKVNPPSAGPQDGLFYILLHGLLFMELAKDAQNGGYLSIKAPQIHGHKLWCGYQGKVQECTDTDIDWRQVGLNGSSSGKPSSCNVPADVDSSILQFGQNDTGTGALNGKTHCLLSLPWPNRFFAIRTDKMPHYISDNPGKTGKKVCDALALCSGGTIGLVTALQYTVSSIIVPGGAACAGKYHYFFEHDPSSQSGNSDINDHLQQAKDLFANGSNFDLKVDKKDVGNYTGWQTQGLPDCIDWTDELSYHEVICLQETAPLLLEELVLKREATRNGVRAAQRKQRLADIQQEVRKLQNKVCIEMVSPANCPNFFVGG